jgi:hypothetical protein
MTQALSLSLKLHLLMMLESSFTIVTCLYYSGLYYKPITIINDDSRVITKLEILLTDDARVLIYNCHMFILQWPVL